MHTTMFLSLLFLKPQPRNAVNPLFHSVLSPIILKILNIVMPKPDPGKDVEWLDFSYYIDCVI